jgi:hypothetical protein
MLIIDTKIAVNSFVKPKQMFFRKRVIQFQPPKTHRKFFLMVLVSIYSVRFNDKTDKIHSRINTVNHFFYSGEETGIKFSITKELILSNHKLAGQDFHE